MYACTHVRVHSQLSPYLLIVSYPSSRALPNSAVIFPSVVCLMFLCGYYRIYLCQVSCTLSTSPAHFVQFLDKTLVKPLCIPISVLRSFIHLPSTLFVLVILRTRCSHKPAISLGVYMASWYNCICIYVICMLACTFASVYTRTFI